MLRSSSYPYIADLQGTPILIMGCTRYLWKYFDLNSSSQGYSYPKMIDWLVDQMIGWLSCCLFDWLIAFWLIDWLIDWLQVKLKIIPVLEHMHHDATTATLVRAACLGNIHSFLCFPPVWVHWKGRFMDFGLYYFKFLDAILVYLWKIPLTNLT